MVQGHGSRIAAGSLKIMKMSGCFCADRVFPHQSIPRRASGLSASYYFNPSHSKKIEPQMFKVLRKSLGSFWAATSESASVPEQEVLGIPCLLM